jgi:hypothetical protein
MAPAVLLLSIGHLRLAPLGKHSPSNVSGEVFGFSQDPAEEAASLKLLQRQKLFYH